MCNASSCCLQFARILLIIFNAAFVLCGLVLMALGIWLLVDPSVLKVLDLTSNAYNSDLLRDSAILILSIGCVVFLSALLGFLGAVLEMKAILGIYIVLLVITFCGEVTGAVLAITFKDWLLDHLETTLRKSITHPDPTYYSNKNGTCEASSDGALWDYVQLKWDCCGVREPPHTGYELLAYALYDNCRQVADSYAGLTLLLPVTCYEQRFDNFSSINSDYQLLASYKFNMTTPKQEGCMDSIEWWVGHYSPVLIGIGFGVAFLQVIGFIFAVCVCVNARRSGFKRMK